MKAKIKLDILLAGSRSSIVGLGHFSRMSALYNVLRQGPEFSPHLAVLGDVSENTKLSSCNVTIVSDTTIAFFNLLTDFIAKNSVTVVVMDFHKSADGIALLNFLKKNRARGVKLIAVDSLIAHQQYLDHIWVPSIHFDLSKVSSEKESCNVSFGWDHFLLARNEVSPNWNPGNEVLVMTGGSDVLDLGAWLPQALDKKLPAASKINWIKGPYSNRPNIPKRSKLDWQVHDSPRNIDKLICSSSYVLTLYGVSFFEAIQYGLPTVVVPLYPSENICELALIRKDKVAMVAIDAESSVGDLVDLMTNDSLAKEISEKAKAKMNINGCNLLVSKISDIIRL